MKNIFKYTNQNVIEKYSEEFNLSLSDAEFHFKGMIKFLITCSKSKMPCYPNAILDNMWHTFILFTRDYYTFCNSYLGQFIHHVPMKRGQEIQKGYFCFIDAETGKWGKKLVRNNKDLISCGGDGDCTSACSGDGNCNSG